MKYKKHAMGEHITIQDNTVYTKPEFTKKVIEYFTPQFKDGDTFYEPCAGDGAFYNYLPEPKGYSEIQEGKDFLEYTEPINWVFSNLPWSSKLYNPIVQHCYDLAENTVHLIRFELWHFYDGSALLFNTTNKIKQFSNRDVHLKEIIFCTWNEAFENRTEGFTLTVIHLKKGHDGPCKINYWF